jgi:hypothetical protein
MRGLWEACGGSQRCLQSRRRKPVKALDSPTTASPYPLFDTQTHQARAGWGQTAATSVCRDLRACDGHPLEKDRTRGFAAPGQLISANHRNLTEHVL